MLIHYTAGGVIVRKDQKEYLFLLLLKKQQEGVEWVLPKGHIEKGETVYEAACREIYEETGIASLKYIGDLGQLFFSYEEEDGLHKKYVDWYLFETDTSKIVPSHEENILEGKWMPYRKATTLLTHSNTLPFLERAYQMLPK